MEEIVEMENKIISKLNEIKKHEIGERKFLNKIKNIEIKKIEMANCKNGSSRLKLKD